MSNPLIGEVRKHPVYRDCSFVVTRRGSANFFGPDHQTEAEAFARLISGHAVLLYKGELTAEPPAPNAAR